MTPYVHKILGIISGDYNITHNITITHTASVRYLTQWEYKGVVHLYIYTGELYKHLARPGRKQARKHVRDARDFNKIETRAVIKFLFLQDKAPKEIHAILTKTVACYLTGRAKDLSARPCKRISASPREPHKKRLISLSN